MSVEDKQKQQFYNSITTSLSNEDKETTVTDFCKSLLLGFADVNAMKIMNIMVTIINDSESPELVKTSAKILNFYILLCISGKNTTISVEERKKLKENSLNNITAEWTKLCNL